MFAASKPYIPRWVALRVAAWARGWMRWRVQPFATRLFGPQYKRSRTRIELNITYACNLSCNNCDRSSPQAPTRIQLSVQQIQQFISESIASQTQWSEIVLIGGEPTIHRDFLEIVEILRSYRDRYSPSTRIEVFTNGFGTRVQKTLSQLPDDIYVENSAKTRDPDVHYHEAFNVAPVDTERYAKSAFSNGCEITQKCGIGMGPGGYYPCGVASSIDRVFGWGIGRQALPEPDDNMADLLNRFCRVCGHFSRDRSGPLNRQLNSPTWAEAYSNYKQKESLLPIYGQSSQASAAYQDKISTVESV